MTTLIDRLKAGPRRTVQEVKAEEGAYPTWALTGAEAVRWQMPDYSLTDNQARAYQVISWINAAIQVVSNLAALQPFQVFRLEGEEKVEIDNHPFETLLARPNPLMSRFELLFATTAYRRLCGNAYWWLNRANEKAIPDEIWVIPSNRIRPIPDRRLYIAGYEYNAGTGAKPETLPSWQVIQFSNWHPRNEFVGLSAVEALAVTAEGDDKMSRWNTAFFAEDNAKFPGVLAFEQMIPDTAWERLQKEFKEAHGGVRQSLRMMRGVGQGGIKWIQTNISPKDMEFLRGREFNREEIFSVLAPGLASMLAVNATEANSLAGRKTLIDMVIWPALVLIAEKLSAQLLPVYGPNLVGEFEDPRIVDRAMKLQEQEIFAQVHTVDEVRMTYYQDDPLGDERGKMLVSEITKPTGLFGGRIQQQIEAEPEVEEREETTIGKARMDELARWRRYALKRDGLKASQFNPEWLPNDIADIIKARLKASTSAEEVSAAFAGPF